MYVTYVLQEPFSIYINFKKLVVHVHTTMFDLQELSYFCTTL